jgi:hypothetical protein
MDNWIIIDRIKRGQIVFSIGEKVVLFRRKGKYPKLEDDIEYTIQGIENDFLLLSNPYYGMGSITPIKVHKTYVFNKKGLRDIKIDILLKTLV